MTSIKALTAKKPTEVGYILNFFKFYLIWKLSLSSFPFQMRI